MRCKRLSTTSALCLILGMLLVSAAAQELVGQRMVAAIKLEGLNRSEAPDLFYTLTDRLGQRLTGSPVVTWQAAMRNERIPRTKQ